MAHSDDEPYEWADESKVGVVVSAVFGVVCLVGGIFGLVLVLRQPAPSNGVKLLAMYGLALAPMLLFRAYSRARRRRVARRFLFRDRSLPASWHFYRRERW